MELGKCLGLILHIVLLSFLNLEISKNVDVWEWQTKPNIVEIFTKTTSLVWNYYMKENNNLTIKVQNMEVNLTHYKVYKAPSELYNCKYWFFWLIKKEL